MNVLQLQVGVKVLLKSPQDKYLFLKKSTNNTPGLTGLWDLPGGRINTGFTLMDNLQREIFEETSLNLVLNPELVMAQDIIRQSLNIHVVRLTYFSRIDTQPVPVLDGVEHSDYKWMTLKEISVEKNFGDILRPFIDYFITTHTTS